MLGRLAAGAVGFGILAVGGGAIVAPRASSGPYGLPVDGDPGLAYVQALGVRDVVVGLLALRFLARDERDALGATLGIGSLIALGDFLVVRRVRGAGPHLLVHGIGGIGMIVAWWLSRAGAGPAPDDALPGPLPLSE